MKHSHHPRRRLIALLSSLRGGRCTGGKICFRTSVFFLISTAFLLRTAQAQKNAPTPCVNAHVSAKATVRGFVFKAYRTADDQGCLHVIRNGKLVSSLKSEDIEAYYLGQPADHVAKIPLLRNGTDLTGSGHPDMIVTSWSGGAHCCFTHYVFELEPKLRIIAKLEDGDADGHFEKMAGIHGYVYVTDDIWSYWPASFAGSVSHKVLLKWTPDGFQLDLNRMRLPPPTEGLWKANLKAVDEAIKNGGDRGEVGLAVWNPVLDLIYTGNSELAWKFVHDVNPAALKDPNPTLEEFCSVLHSSPYWPDLAPTVKDAPADCSEETKGAQAKQP